MNLKSYSGMPELSRAIAYFVFRKNGTDFEKIKERFNRFDEEIIKIALQEAASPSTRFININFDNERNTYRPSTHLLSIYRTLNMV